MNELKNNHFKRNVKILDIWNTDFDDIRCSAILYQDNRTIAKIIASYDEHDIKALAGNVDLEIDYELIENAIESLIYDDYDNYLELPKLSECSSLLQSIYEEVCSTEYSMCYISDEDWNEYYAENYNENDIKILEHEIKKYKLEDIIRMGENEYKIVGYGDLETRFIDDRNLEKYNESEMEL